LNTPCTGIIYIVACRYFSYWFGSRAQMVAHQRCTLFHWKPVCGWM